MLAAAAKIPLNWASFQRRDKTMKLVIAVIKPFKLDEVRDALTRIGVHGMTVTEVKGYGRQKGHMEIYRGKEYAVNFLPKLRLEVAIASEQIDQVVDALTAAAKTGQIGDGKIFVTTIDQAVRIRTGETDTQAL
jgi:nitrogen regulatory protein P-II 2